MKLYCKEKGAILLNIGMPGVKKLGIVERLIRSLQEMFSVTINDIVSKRSLKRELKITINIYNNQNHTHIGMSPKKFLESDKITKNPWELSSGSDKLKSFDYFSNKKIIKKKLYVLKKKFPLNASVRLFKKVSRNLKRSHYSNWTNEIFFIDGYKKPLLSKSDIGIYIRNQKGERIKGITYPNFLKLVKLPDYLEIKKVNRFLKSKKAIRCSFVNFPDSYYKDIPLTEIFSKYHMNNQIKKKILDWKTNNGI